MTADPAAGFVGCKAAFFHGRGILTYLRDDLPDLAWANMWDLPGGGREGEEDPETCLLRELHEEFGLRLPRDRLVWRRVFPSMTDPSRPSVFYAGHLTAAEIAAIRFGDEGQRWEVMPVAAWLRHSDGVPALQARTALAAAELGIDTGHPAEVDRSGSAP